MTRTNSRRSRRDRRFKRGLRTVLAITAVLALMLITGSGFFTGHRGAVDPGPGVTTRPKPSDLPVSSDMPEDGGAETSDPPSGGKDEPGRPQTIPDPERLQYAGAENASLLHDSYFDDAVFIGNSRTEGLKMYSGLTKSTFITEVGLTVDSIFTDYCNISGGYKNLAFSELESREFGKVYIMLGMNELGWVYDDVFKEDYGKIIDRIREINPDAVIYIQSILPVSKWKDSNDSTYTIANVDRLNARLRELADEKEVHYVDVAEGIMDEEGYLPYEATLDGVHLVPEYCVKWLDYLKTHTAQ